MLSLFFKEDFSELYFSDDFMEKVFNFVDKNSNYNISKKMELKRLLIKLKIQITF